MAFYSVWDWNRNAYKVYDTPRPVSVGDDPVAPNPRPLTSLGCDPDTQVKPLPRGAKFRGYSHMARGEIRRPSGGLLGDVGDDAGSSGMPRWMSAGIGIALGAGAMWWLGGRLK